MLLQPDLVLGDTIVNLTPEVLAKCKIKGLILDVDETLVPIRQSDVSPELEQWISKIRNFTTIWLVSNNLSKNRISRIAKSLDLPYLLAAKKPSRRKLKEAAINMNLPIEEIAMVGDRLFTDVLAGNRTGMFTILVEPMVDSAQATISHPIRNFEVWLSQKLGVSLATNLENVNTSNNSQKK